MDYHFEAQQVIDALRDPRITRVLELVIRDQAIEKNFRQMKEQGFLSRVAIERLAEEFCLSEEQIRTIVYHKRDNRG